MSDESKTRISPNVDIADPKDAALVRNLLNKQAKSYRKRRFELTDDFLATMVHCTTAGMHSDDMGTKLTATRIGVELVKINQADDHNAEKYERIDAGLSVGDITLKIEPPRVLGQPTEVTPDMERALGLRPEDALDTARPALDEGSGSD